MNEPAHVISKIEKEVEIVLTTSEKLSGILFAKQYERVSDILNDDRPFIPFRGADDVVRIIAKKNIYQVIPIEQKEVPKEQQMPFYQGRI